MRVVGLYFMTSAFLRGFRSGCNESLRPVYDACNFIKAPLRMECTDCTVAVRPSRDTDSTQSFPPASVLSEHLRLTSPGYCCSTVFGAAQVWPGNKHEQHLSAKKKKSSIRSELSRVAEAFRSSNTHRNIKTKILRQPNPETNGKKYIF